jgi:hypothetical protein
MGLVTGNSFSVTTGNSLIVVRGIFGSTVTFCVAGLHFNLFVWVR